MTVQFGRCGGFLLLWLILVEGLYAEDLDTVLIRHVGARGGLEAIQAISTLATDGVIDSLGTTTPFRVRRTRPGSIRIEMDFDEGTMIQAYDGENAWLVDSLSGESKAKLMEDGPAASLIMQSAFDGVLIQHEELGAQVELAGREQIRGEDMWRLEVHFDTGNQQTIFLGAMDHLVRHKRISRKQGKKTFEVTTTFEDYRPVKGVQMAHRVVSQTVINQWFDATSRSSDRRPLVITTYNRIEAGVEIDPLIFSMPSTQSEIKH